MTISHNYRIAGQAPIQMRPFMIASLWDMLQLNNANLLSAIGYLSATTAQFRHQALLAQKGLAQPAMIDLEMKAWIVASVERLRDAARELKMASAEAASQRAHDACQILASPHRLGARDLDHLATCLHQMVQVFADEMRGRLVFSLPGRHAHFFGDAPHFGEDVEDAFPSAIFDIQEAAKCRAVGRWTASVMHLMRVMEAGLGALAHHYDVSADANWNQVINQIEARTREVGKRSHGPEAEQWAAEAATHLRFVKNAWRNHAMHPLEKYDEERAVSIFDSCRAFMRHLAAHLTEDEAECKRGV